MKSTVRQFITSTWLFAVFVCHNPATKELVIGKQIIARNALLDRRRWFVQQWTNSPHWTEIWSALHDSTVRGGRRCNQAWFADQSLKFVVAELWQE